MKNILTIMAFLGCSATLFSQSKIAVTKGAGTQFYYSLDSALKYADDTSILYLPGGNFAVGTLVISKSVRIIGAGFWPDSTLATGKTTISGNLNIKKGADSGSLCGLEIKGNVQFGDAASNGASNYGISRCSMYELWLGYTSSNAAASSVHDLFISESFISSSVFGNYAKNCVFLKNMVGGNLNYFNGNVQFVNNLFLYEGIAYGATMMNTVSSCEFKNNVFLKSTGCSYCTVIGGGSDYNVFANNIFTETLTFPMGNNSGTGNIFGKTTSDIFVNYQTNVFVADYRMKSTGPGKNAGTDGYDIGIYGTSYPWKDGAVPFNPHIQKRDIATETDGSGKIKVNIKVQAQNR